MPASSRPAALSKSKSQSSRPPATAGSTAAPSGNGSAKPILTPRSMRTRKTPTPAPHPHSYSQPINTNLNAHLRTDPINALSVLLKLLTSLPSRIGGCQYKLTQPEHALCLHLVGVLDPFVYHGVRALAPSSTSGSGPNMPPALLIQQPTEILDAILGHVDSKKDLLSVGLGCKRLWDVVFPRHWEYRVIRCKVSSVSVWNHLVKHKSLARNVRRLEIIDERAPSSSSSPTASSQNLGMLVPSGILQSDTDLETTDDEYSSLLSLHAKHERYFCAALARMTGLKELRWACNHSPVSITHPGVWNTLVRVSVGGLREMVVSDNLVFAPGLGAPGEESSSDSEESGESEPEEDGAGKKKLVPRIRSTALPAMESAVFRSTPHSYGAAKQPELKRIAAMLHQCVNLKNLEITYIAPRSLLSSGAGGVNAALGPGSSHTRPVADEFLLYSRWANLTTLTLTNLRCASPIAPSSFLGAHPGLEVLHMDMVVHHAHTAGGTGGLYLREGALPRLREVKASKEVINAILECPCPEVPGGRRPLEVVKGFKLSGNSHPASSSLNSSSSSSPTSHSSRSVADSVFLANLRQAGSGIRRVEMVGWHDMEDVRKVAGCLPHVQWLDVGRRLGGGGAAQRAASSSTSVLGPVTNMVEWTEVLATLPELATVHGVRFFYEVSNVAMTATSAAASGPSALPVCAPSSHLVVAAAAAATNSTNNTSWSGVTTPSSGPAASTREASALALTIATSSKTVHPTTSASSASMSMMERSRMRKNDEIAGVLAWKCKKLRRVDHWEEGGGKVVVLLRDEGGHGKEKEGKVRWEVRRVKQ
ncbi:hypothetical protein GALMADRAFT_453238 [Galerina marginata CBS 339.88]|uniref:F-box domain-containing protein n=1 Tax=Galerina marginata (strain CBS 339.88) TaxID=685588 RepID=A0A067T0N1_GALM3|nr:hypothetical protein GALMADRAFT_453238 [Galerina marginata CBS 339.88]